MRKISMIFAMAAIVLTSCVKETPITTEGGNTTDLVPSGELVEMTFTASSAETKTYLDGSKDADGKLILKWSKGDEISVWDGFENRRFTMVGDPDGASANFTGYVDKNAKDFYVIYPYAADLTHTHINQDNQGKEREVFSLNKPEIQYANPDGGLADGTAYACGKVDVDNRQITFKSRSSILKFRLAEGMDVKSITIEGNEEDDILAGTVNLSFYTETGEALTPGFNQSAEKFTAITLCNKDGSNLKTEVDYYFALLTNEFKEGYTISITLSDGKVLTRKSTNSAKFSSNNIHTLSSKSLTKGMFDYYEGYLAGEDIVIAGKVYNNETYGNPTLIAQGQTATISTNGVYFIEDGAVVEYSPTNSLSKMIIVGRDPSVRSPMIQKMHFKMATNGVLAVMNLAIDSQLGSNYLFNIYGTNTPKSYAVDNCSMKFTNKHFLYHAKNTWVSEVQFHNCDIEFTYSSDDIWLFNVNTSAPSVDLFDFQNNVFWHSGTMAADKAFRITNGEGLDIRKLIFKNNTFINLPTRAGRTSYIGSESVSGEVSGNLIYLPTQPVNASMLHSSSTGVTFGTNYYYTGTDVTFGPFTATEGNPFTTCEVENGKFVKDPAYKDYGAKR